MGVSERAVTKTTAVAGFSRERVVVRDRRSGARSSFGAAWNTPLVCDEDLTIRRMEKVSIFNTLAPHGGCA